MIYTFALIGFLLGGWGIVLISWLSLIKERKTLAEGYSFPTLKDKKHYIWHG
jgi:hypothetical protein